MKTDWDNSWYTPGDWKLPTWWTSGVQVRVGFTPTYADQVYFYNSPFVKNVLKHTGGMKKLPPTV